MKAEEFMIGDWVLGLVEDNEEIGKIIAKHPARIIKIEENGDYAAQCPYTFDEMYEGDGTPIEDFLWYDTEPMPLTAEILSKNGFVSKKGFMQKGNFGDGPLMIWHTEDNKILRHFTHELEISDLSSDKGYRIRFICNYVHQLQHALRLCGINKEIVL